MHLYDPNRGSILNVDDARLEGYEYATYTDDLNPQTVWKLNVGDPEVVNILPDDVDAVELSGPDREADEEEE